MSVMSSKCFIYSDVISRANFSCKNAISIARHIWVACSFIYILFRISCDCWQFRSMAIASNWRIHFSLSFTRILIWHTSVINHLFAVRTPLLCHFFFRFAFLFPSFGRDASTSLRSFLAQFMHITNELVLYELYTAGELLSLHILMSLYVCECE